MAAPPAQPPPPIDQELDGTLGEEDQDAEDQESDLAAEQRHAQHVRSRGAGQDSARPPVVPGADAEDGLGAALLNGEHER